MRTAWILLPMTLLAGCGGTPDDIACSIVGCKPSSGIASSELAPSYVVQVGDGGTLATGSFRTGGGAAADVQLDTDQLLLRVDNAAPLAFTSDALRLFWSAASFTASASGTYSVDFIRANGSAIASSVVPPAFAITSPAAPMTMNVSSPPLAIAVNVPRQEQLVARLDATCANQAHVTGHVEIPRPVLSGSDSVYMLPPGAVSAVLGAKPGRGPTSCEVTLLMGRETRGTLGIGFRADGYITGRFERKVDLHFDMS